MVDQMRFNLHTPADPTNMTTRFKLRPTPIVLQRVPSSIPHGPMPFEKRMEIASRLAQREIEKQSLYSSENVTEHYQLHGQNRVSNNDKVASNPSSIPATVLKSINKPPSKSAILPKQHLKQRKPSSNSTTFKQNVIDDCKKSPPTLKNTNNHIKMAAEDEIDLTTHEILKLRKDLTRKIQKFKVLSLRADLEEPSPLPDHSTIVPSSDNGRLTWLEEDKLEKKEKIKTRGQAVRNARLLYQLQQKVKEAQQDIKGSDHSSKDRLIAMHKLASAHRAAVRTLHHLSSIGIYRGATHGYPQKVTSHDEIIGLIKQLSSLCVEAHVGGANIESEDERMTSLLKELHDYHTHVKRLLGNNRHDNVMDKLRQSPVSTNRGTRLSKWRKNQPKAVSHRGGVLLNRHKKRSGCKEPHFARQTCASTQKKSPKKRLVVSSHQRPLSPSHVQDTPLSYMPHPPSSQTLPHTPPNSHLQSQLPPSSQQLSHSLSLTNSPLPCSLSSHTISPSPPFEVTSVNNESLKSLQMPWEHEGQTMVEREMARQIWLDRQAIELVQKRRQQNKNNTKGNQRKHRHFRKTDRKGDRELSEQERRERGLADEEKSLADEERRERGLADEEKSLVDEERRERGLADEEKRERGLADELKTDITDEVLQSNKVDDKQEDINEKELELNGIQTAGLENIMSKIQEMEKERMDVQRKWQSISYETESCTNERGNSSGSNTRVNVTGPSDNNRRPVTVLMSDMDIYKYKHKYNHYLKMTGVKTDGGFNPWELVDNICDEIFDELLQETSNEIQLTVDSCIELLYDNEFRNPL